MKLATRRYAGLILAVIMALTSATAAVVQGKMRDAAGRMVLCSGHGPVSVRVDSRGRPMDELPICPDYIPTVPALDVVPPLPGAPERLARRVAPAPVPLPAARPPFRTLRVRGPPPAG